MIERSTWLKGAGAVESVKEIKPHLPRLDTSGLLCVLNYLCHYSTFIHQWLRMTTDMNVIILRLTNNDFLL